MKFNVYMKCPDALDRAIDDAVENRHPKEDAEELREYLKELCSRWFLYGEVIKLEIDTDLDSCMVLDA